MLPFILPLAGANPIDTHQLADSNGQFTIIDDAELYYVHYENNGDTILLIHGQGGSTLSWQDTIPALSDAGFNIYAVDLLGAGLSEKGLHLDYSHPYLANLLLEFLQQENIDSVLLVAHAFSSNIAVMMAQIAPEKIDNMVLVAPTLISEDPPEIPSVVFELPFLERGHE